MLNQYGVTTSELNAGMPTDRCVAEWHIADPRVALILDGSGAPRPEIVARIEVPANIGTLRRTDQPKAREIQKRVSEQFLKCFRNDLAVVGFERSEESGTYLLAKWPFELNA